jgi:imidazolonepropionase-like amidohydrolase
MLPDTAASTGPTLLLRGATVLTAAGPQLDVADVLIAGDRIQAVGASLEAPAGVRVIDVSGRWITPGLIDAHSHIGVYPTPVVPPHSDGNEMSSPFTPHVRALESFWPQDPSIRYAVAGGVTSILTLPGSANLVGGQGATLRLVPGLAAAGMQFPGAPATMKMACGENPKFVYGVRKKTAPGTRMGEVAMLRQELANAQSYKTAPDAAVDYKKQALQKVVSGETLIQNHCYRADEMLLRLDLFREFGITPRAFHHAVEAYKIRTQLAEANVGVATWADWWGRKIEMLDAVPAGVALLDSAGVKVAVHSDSPYDGQRLNQEAAKAMAAGQRIGLDVDRARAIRWVTANPAWIAGIESQVGTLEPGKQADLVVWSGDPFSVYTRAQLVFIAGDQVFDRAQPGSFPLSDFELGVRKAVTP